MHAESSTTFRKRVTPRQKSVENLRIKLHKEITKKKKKRKNPQHILRQTALGMPNIWKKKYAKPYGFVYFARFCIAYTQEQPTPAYCWLKQVSQDNTAAEDKWTVSLRVNTTHYSQHSQKSISKSGAKANIFSLKEKKKQPKTTLWIEKKTTLS